MTFVAAVGAMVMCVVLGAAASRLPQLRGASGPVTMTVEPPVVPAVVGLLGVGLIGATVLGGPVSNAALAFFGFALVALAEELVSGRPVGFNRLTGVALVLGACTLPLVRYGTLTFAELRSAAFVLGAPLTAGPPLRLMECLLGGAVGLAAAAWLSGEPAGPASPATVAVRPRLLVPGAAAVLLVATFAGTELPAGQGAGPVLARFALWGLLVILVTGVEVIGGRFLRRFSELGIPAAVGAALLAGAAAGLAA